MSSVPMVPILPKRPRGRMARRMLLVLMPLTLLPLLIIGFITYEYGRDFIRQQAFILLRTIADTQGQRIVEQVDNGVHLFNHIIEDAEFQASLQEATKLNDRSSPEYIDVREEILHTLAEINRAKSYFDQFLLITPDGTIHLATQENWQGKRILESQFLDLLSEAPVTRAIFVPKPLDTGAGEIRSNQSGGKEIETFVFMTATPFLDGRGKPLAYMVGLADHTTIRDYVQSAAFYSKDFYFITPEGNFIALNPYSNSKNKLVYLPATEEQKQKFLKDLTSDRSRVMELDASVHMHREPVIAAQTWLEGLQIGWTVEVLQSQIYGQIDQLVNYLAILFGGLFLINVIIIILLTRSLTRPVLDLANTVQLFADGNWDMRSGIDRNDEVGFLADSFNNMADELSIVHGRLETQVRERTGELNTLAQISQIIISSFNLDDLLGKTIQLLNEKYQFTYTAIFLSDLTGYGDSQYASLHKAYGNPDVMERVKQHRVPISDKSNEALAGWSIATNRAQVRPLKSTAGQTEEPLAQPQFYEVAIPIAIGDQVLGAFNIYSTVNETGAKEIPFSPRVLSELQTIATQIATSVRNFQLIETSQINIDEAKLLFQAGHQITQAENESDIFRILQETLEQCDYRSAVLLASKDRFKVLYHWTNKLNPSSQQIQIPPSIAAGELSYHFNSPKPVVVNDLRNSHLPQELLDIPRLLGCFNAAYVPAIQGDRLVALLVLGSAPHINSILQGIGKPKTSADFSAVKLQPFTNLIQLFAITMDKLHTQQDTRRRLLELETLWEIAQMISIETDLNTLFQTIHHHIEQAIGRLDTIGIGLFNAKNQVIEFPYMFEEGKVLKIPPFHLGQGLTSLVLNSKKPLLLVEGTEQKSRELGALTVGKPAKSWLGVPLIFSGDAIGIIIVQDNVNEHRFTKEDQRLLSTMAAQVSVAVRNARLLETTRDMADQERLVNEITAKIRRSVDIQSILKTTTHELGSAFKLRRARIEIRSNQDLEITTEPETSDNGNKPV